ncbi:MAG: gluconokinase [Anaerolineales bacterium]|nr:gluconokinase [Anaerolineales bacterium]
MGLVVGLDLGTTRCKAVAVTPAGTVAAAASADYALHTPHPGWAEQPADAVWRGAVAALQALAAQAPARQIEGLGLSGAMHSLLPVNADGAPLAPALTWADQRAAPQAEALRRQLGSRAAHALYTRTGCRLNALYHPAKLRWWREAAPAVWVQAARFVALKDWVLWRLTGAWLTDEGLASTTGLLDLRRLEWDFEALSAAGIEASRLPALSPAAVVGGTLLPAAARATGLPAGLPVAPGSSDGGAANLGAGAVLPGQTVVTVGTSGAVRRLVAEPWLDQRERTWCYVLAAGHWFAGGAINNGGLALQWVRERFYADEPGDLGYARLLQEAAAIAPGAEGVVVLPYFSGERSPHWNPEARAVVTGLGLEHTRAHIARAALEGVAYCLADVWAALGQPPSAPGLAWPEACLTGSISRNPIWAQIVADVLGAVLLADQAADASAVGGALFGHLALGHLACLEDAAHRPPLAERYTPDPRRHAEYAERHQHFQALYARLFT